MPNPNFFIVGAPKAGTTSLVESMSYHPEVFFSPIKEPNYYCDDIRDLAHNRLYNDALKINIKAYLKKKTKPNLPSCLVKNHADYIQLFDNASVSKAIGECSTNYLLSKNAAKNIFDDIPNAKIIAILRNPVKRAFSHYLMNKRIGITKESFSSHIKNEISGCDINYGNSSLYIETGKYSKQLQRYYSVFKKKQILIIFFEDLISQSKKTLDTVYRFLEVNPLLGERDMPVLNSAAIARFEFINSVFHKTGVKRKLRQLLSKNTKRLIKRVYFKKTDEKISIDDHNFLINIYKEEIKDLENMIGKNLSHWLI